MTLSELISIWGNRKRLAAAIGEGETTVRNWFNRGSIPWWADERIIFQAAQKGHALTLADLHEVRRELASAKAARGHAPSRGREPRRPQGAPVKGEPRKAGAA